MPMMPNNPACPISVTEIARLLENAPDPDVGGRVCTVGYVDAYGRRTYAVLHTSDSGTGWSSAVTTTSLETALLAGEILADICQATLIDCHCEEESEP